MMPNYKGQLPGRRRIVINHQGRQMEWVIQGTKADGDKFEAQKRQELWEESANPDRLPAVTFARLSEKYAEHAKLHLKESTWNKVRIYQVAMLVEFFAQHPIDRLSSPQSVDGYKKMRAKSVGATCINNDLRVLKTILNWGRESGYPVPEIKWKRLPVRGLPEVKAWTVEQLTKIYTACREEAPSLLPILIFLTNTGARKGEALACRWDWIDFHQNLISIPSNKFWQPKSGKPRHVPLSSALGEVLQGNKKHPLVVFPNRNGEQYVDFPKDIFWRVLQRAGVQGHPHMFRHTYASHFLQAVPDLFLLAKILGHSSTRVTEIYSHLLPGALSRAMNAVNFGANPG